MRSYLAASLLLCTLVATAFAGATLLSISDAQADHSDSAIDLVAVDPNIAGNTATSLGPIETCLRIEPGASVEIDVVVNAIPADRPMTAFQFDLLYDPAIVNVTGNNFAMLLAANPGFTPVGGLSDQVPDSDGDFLVAVADFSTASPPETGPGVLSRITLTAVSSGVTTLSPANVDIRDDRNEKMTPISLAAAYLAVGEACPSGAPTPLVTLGAPSTPGAEPGTTPVTPGPATPEFVTPEPGTPDLRTPSVAATATAVALRNAQADSGDGNDGDGFPVWIIVIIVVGGLAAASGGAYLLVRRLR